MVAEDQVTIRFEGSRLSYLDACQVAEQAGSSDGIRMVVLDLERTSETNTAALAKLVVLRIELLGSGRDLRIRGLSGRANGLYELNRMTSLLPRGPDDRRINALASCRQAG